MAFGTCWGTTAQSCVKPDRCDVGLLDAQGQRLQIVAAVDPPPPTPPELHFRTQYVTEIKTMCPPIPEKSFSSAHCASFSVPETTCLVSGCTRVCSVWEELEGRG